MAVPVEPPSSPDGLDVRDLPSLARAATMVHHGSMDIVDRDYRNLMRWADTTGERIEGYSREVYLDCDGPPDTWVTELQYALVEEPAARR
jgi:effector-binding domain-containing protein